MKFTELRDKDINELNNMLKDKKLELYNLRLRLKTMQLTNPKEIALIRKDIARINTAISAKNN